MKRLMLHHAFRFVSREIFLVGPENVRSQRAVERIGAFRAGSRRDAVGRESYLYEITASRFLQTAAPAVASPDMPVEPPRGPDRAR